MPAVIGHLWVAKDERNRTYLRGYLYLNEINGRRKRVYVTKIVQNKSKTLPSQHDFTAYDFTVGKPKWKPPTPRKKRGPTTYHASTNNVQHRNGERHTR